MHWVHSQKRRGASPVKKAWAETVRPYMVKCAALPWRTLTLHALLFGLWFAILAGGSWMLDLVDRSVGEIHVRAHLQHQDTQALQTLLLPYKQQSFFAVDLDALQARLEEFAWVARAQVGRRWPDQIIVSIREQKPFAYWNDGFITDAGLVFQPEGELPELDLPRFSSPLVALEPLLSRYQDWAPQMQALGLQIAALQVDLRGAWSLELRNGLLVKLGREHMDRRMAAFIRHYPQLLTRLGEARAAGMRTVDLRYSHGMSVEWTAAQGETPARNDQTESEA